MSLKQVIGRWSKMMQIEMPQKQDYLYVIVTVDFGLSRAKALFAQAIARARELSITRLLGDIRGMGAYESGSNIVGRHEIASSVAEQLPHDMKVAFLSAEHQMDKFNESVSVNRGARTLSTTVLDEALEWLLK
jgi:hypothetical protein